MAKIEVRIPTDKLTEREKNELNKFKELYPASECKDNPFICVEAIGYLKHMNEYFPTLSEYIDQLIMTLTLVSVGLLVEEEF